MDLYNILSINDIDINNIINNPEIIDLKSNTSLMNESITLLNSNTSLMNESITLLNSNTSLLNESITLLDSNTSLMNSSISDLSTTLFGKNGTPSTIGLITSITNSINNLSTRITVANANGITYNTYNLSLSKNSYYSSIINLTNNT